MSFERANILWNIIGVLTHIGSNEKRATEDSIKIAAKNYQTALGVMVMLKALLEAHPAAAANLDLSNDALTMTNWILTAAGQECYFDLAVKGGKMPADAVSKLAFQVSLFAGKAVSLIETSSVLKDSSVPRKWLSYLKLKQQMFHALAHYYMSQFNGANAAYGEQVGRLAIAHKLLDTCKKDRADKYIPELTDSLNALAAKITPAYAAAHKDNNTIYFEPVPSSEAKMSTQLAGHVMVKTTEVEASKLTCKDDEFSKIVPFAVQKADSVYCESRGDLIRSIGKKIEENDGLGKTVLAELGLPASLDSMDGNAAVDALQAKITTLKNEGGAAMLKEKSKLLEEIAEADSQILRQALAILDAEESEDKAARSQYGSSPDWQRTPSHTLNAHLRQEAHKFMANFEQARKSDEFIKSKFSSVSSHISKLASLNRDALLLELPSDDSTGDKSMTVAVELRQRVAQLTHLSAARSTLISQLRNLAADDNILNKLLAQASRDGDQALFDKELAKFQPLLNQINATFDTQTQLIHTITDLNQSFLASRRVTPAMEHRQQVLQTYETAFDAYVALKSHLKEGAEFYTRFQSLLDKFKTKCGDFAFARKTELEDLVEEQKSKAKAAASTPKPVASPATSAAAPAPAGYYYISGTAPIMYGNPQQSAPSMSPHTSNVQIAKPQQQYQAAPQHYQQHAPSPNHPSSIFASPAYGTSSPSPPQPQYYPAAGAAPQQGQGTHQLPAGYTVAQLPPGFSYQSPPNY